MSFIFNKLSVNVSWQVLVLLLLTLEQKADFTVIVVLQNGLIFTYPCLYLRLPTVNIST